MAELHAFFDRDIMFKLAYCGVWTETLSALGVTHPYRLASTSVTGAQSVARKWGADAGLRTSMIGCMEGIVQNLLLIPAAWSPIENAECVDLYNRIIYAKGIDPGEALLVVAALSCPYNNNLITGDKRFIQALATNFPDIYEQLYPQLISFERCLLAVCQKSGYGTIQERLINARACDGTLKLALGAGTPADVASFMEVLRSYCPLSSMSE